MKVKIGTVVVFVFLSGLSFGHAADADPDTTLRTKMNEPIISMIDSLLTLKFLQSNKFSADKTNKYNFPADSVPKYSEAVYKQRIKKMDTKTPMEFVYNDKVQAFIDLYAVRYRKYSQQILGMTEIYFPMFEQALDKYDIPLELKYLPIVESALNPKAKSPAGAMGLWQFMMPTGKLMGLEINSYIDERCDPIKATDAACRYLKYLYGFYKDWNMTLAAYNAGPGTVNNAIRRSGGKTTYWEIYNYLPAETQGYVPAFIGVVYVMTHSAEHNMYPIEPKMRYFEYDTVQVTQQLDMNNVAAMLNMDIDELKFLNPVYKTTVIPKLEGKTSYLYLPKDKLGDFVVKEDSIYNYNKRPDAETVLASEKVHTVRKGEYLSTIATKYAVSVADIKKWNNLSSNSVSPGKRLVIKTTEGTADNNSATVAVNENKTAETKVVTANNTGATQKAATTTYKTYTVKSGDSLWYIANKYGVTVDQIKKQNGLKGNSLQTGQKLKIPVKGNG